MGKRRALKPKRKGVAQTTLALPRFALSGPAAHAQSAISPKARQSSQARPAASAVPAAASVTQKPEAFLVGDIGATNCRIAFYDSKLEQVFKSVVPSKSIRLLQEHLKELLEKDELAGYRVERAAIAVAGPVSKDKSFCKFTNISWIVDVHILRRELGLQSVVLLNDFLAIGYGLPRLPPTRLVSLSTDEGVLTDYALNENIHVIVGPGTGLGVCLLMRSAHGDYVPMPSEGGNAPLSVGFREMIPVAKYLSRRMTHLSNEDVLSGRGLAHLYSYCYRRDFIKRRVMLRRPNVLANANDPAQAVTLAAFEHNDKVAQEALRLFTDQLAIECQNLALTTLCSRLYIAGGIPMRILPELQRHFRHAFIDHPTHKDVLSLVEILVVTDEDVGLFGAAMYLQRQLRAQAAHQ